jgi:hypothetical protein
MGGFNARRALQVLIGGDGPPPPGAAGLALGVQLSAPLSPGGVVDVLVCYIYIICDAHVVLYSVDALLCNETTLIIALAEHVIGEVFVVSLQLQ